MSMTFPGMPSDMQLIGFPDMTKYTFRVAFYFFLAKEYPGSSQINRGEFANLQIFGQKLSVLQIQI